MARRGPGGVDPLVVLGDTSSLTARVDIEERDVAAIALGTPVTIHAKASPGCPAVTTSVPGSPRTSRGRPNAVHLATGPGVGYHHFMNAELIKSKLQALPLTNRSAIADWRVRTGLDSTGDPAVWVYVVLRDDLVESFEAGWEAARWQIKAAVAEVAPDVFTYIRMQFESEVAPDAVAYW